MTKLRLQHQQGRSSPTFTGRPSSSNGLGGSLGGSLGSSLGSGSGGVGGVGVGHERGEWRRSGSAGSAAMMEDYHRSVAEDGPSGPASFRCVVGGGGGWGGCLLGWGGGWLLLFSDS